MRFYLDTEFNGHGGELLSLALVSEWVQVPTVPHKQEFHWYAARRMRSQPIQWVRENVMPVVRAHFLSAHMFEYDFRGFIQRWPGMDVYCDWHDDARHFCELLSGETYEESLDFPVTIHILKTPPGEPVSRVPHNALEDARALRDWHEAILLKAA